MDVIVIGGVAAGMSAASKLKRLDPSVNITVFEKGRDLSYGACGMPYYLSGLVEHVDDLIAKTAADFKNMAINVFLEHEVVAVDPKTQSVTVKHQSKTKKVRYDKLIIATGASAIRLPVENSHLNGIHVLNSLEDVKQLKAALDQERVQKVAIIGGGYIGLEVADNIRAIGKDVLIIEREKNLLPIFDEMIAKNAKKTCEENGVMIKLDETVKGYQGDNAVTHVVTNKNTYGVDLVIEAIGIRPNTKFLEDTAIKRIKNGAIVVNSNMETTASSIYAAGDCVAYPHQLYDGLAYVPLGTHANKAGRVIAENIAGNKLAFAGVIGSSVLKVFDQTYAKAGLSEAECKQYDIPCDSVHVKAKDKAGYYQGAEIVEVKLLFNPQTKQLLGAQMFGKESVGTRINIIAVAIQQKMTSDVFAQLDLAYAPPYSPVYDPLLIAAMQIK